MGLSLVNPPTGEPIDVSMARKQCNIAFDDDDELLQEFLIPAARDRAEQATRRALLDQTWDLTLDALPDEGWVELPKAPARSVTYLKYYDTSGTLQTWDASNYVVDAPAGPRCQRGRLSLAYGVVWPLTQARPGAVTIRFVAGYGSDPSDVPPLLRQAMLLDIAALYAVRETLIVGDVATPVPGGSEDIYRTFRSYPTQRRAA